MTGKHQYACFGFVPNLNSQASSPMRGISLYIIFENRKRNVIILNLHDGLVVKYRVHYFSMHVVMNKCFQKNFDTDSSCRFRENAKNTFNSEK